MGERDEKLIEHLRARLGADTREEIRPAVAATLRALGQMFSPRLRDRVAPELPPWAAEQLCTEQHQPPPPDLVGVLADVARETGLSLGQALDVADAVAESLADHFDAETDAMVRAELPPAIAKIFERHEAPPPPEHAHVEPPRHTLSSGRPGSTHPVSSSAPESAHPHPHRLSSSPPTRQEEAGETLASGHPGRHR